ncbi:hypothetical protein CKK33_00725 [Mucilaginibacter sp. MD40]|uniref:TIR domain-containing protein n=1 Tax=Mucilaginibacter sp. MD40 TaxID=2029590 RepID=UPI000BAC8FF2|nr:TIR domain-containing protein [Mucilaginibacter sp. MD40]PAW92094.1 hypothetical protein CKK33_00725 [Mucilaginibacter sp. MD40]
MMSLDEYVINKIGLPESDRLKYDALLPSSAELGRVICAFSNTDGGVLILGILVKNNKISIKGLSADFQVNVVLTNALSKLSPNPSVQSDFVVFQEKRLFVIKVDKSDQVIAYNQTAYGIKSKEIYKLEGTTAQEQPATNNEVFLDRILNYLIDNPGLINVNKHTIRETILNNKISVSDAQRLLAKLKIDGHVKSYGDRYIGYSADTKSFMDNGGYSKSTKNYSTKLGGKHIFISYQWHHKLAANKLYEFLKTKGYIPSMDDHQLSYKDSISTFMESIRASDFAVLIISDEYLKSENCMMEVLHVLKERNSQQKILPIRHEDVRIFKTADRIKYVEFWQTQVRERERILEGIEATNAIEEIKKLRIAKQIYQDIGDFLSAIADMIINTIEEQEKTSYQSIMNFIDGNNKNV